MFFGSLQCVGEVGNLGSGFGDDSIDFGIIREAFESFGQLLIGGVILAII